MAADVVVERAEHAHRVLLRGEVDLASAEGLERAVLRETVGARAVVLDLSGVSYLDSAGVRLLDHLARAFGRRRSPLRIVAPPGGQVRLVLRIVAYGEDLLDDDLAAAERALARG
jgi:anti-sigma B factor antagonist